MGSRHIWGRLAKRGRNRIMNLYKRLALAVAIVALGAGLAGAGPAQAEQRSADVPASTQQHDVNTARTHHSGAVVTSGPGSRCC
jgi:hypothetical protein